MESTATQFSEKLSTVIKSKMETFHSEILAEVDGFVKEMEKEKDADVERAVTEIDIRYKTDQAKWNQERKNLLLKISKNNKKMQTHKQQVGEAMEQAIKDMDRNYQNDKATWAHERDKLLLEKQNWMKEREDLLTERNHLLLKIESDNQQIKGDEQKLAEAIDRDDLIKSKINDIVYDALKPKREGGQLTKKDFMVVVEDTVQRFVGIIMMDQHQIPENDELDPFISSLKERIIAFSQECLNSFMRKKTDQKRNK